MVQYFPVITGSLTVTGSVFVSGSITATGGVTISGSIDSASYAANAERLDNLDSTSFVFTSSYNQDSSSFSTRTTNLETASGSFSTRVTTIESKYATTGSNIFTANQTICGNLTTTGTITAQTINVQQVTSSVVYSSGSNIFGCQLSDTQQFTGSMFITGSNMTARVGSTCLGGMAIVTSCLGVGQSPNGYVLDVCGAQRTIGSLTINEDGAGTKVLTVRSDWAGVDPAINVTTNNCLLLMTNNTVRVCLSNTGIATFACQVCAPVAIISGCVGIGTVSPSSLLTTARSTSGNVATFTANTSVSGCYSGITLNNTTVGGVEWYGSEIRNINTSTSPDFYQPRLGFFTQNTSTYLPTDRTEKMSILGNGNIGVGTTSPTTVGSYKVLEVAGPNTSVGGMYRTQISDASIVGKFYSNSTGIWISSETTHPLILETSNTERVRITSTGIACFACQVCAPRLYLDQNSNGEVQFIVANNQNCTGASSSARIDIGTWINQYALTLGRAGLCTTGTRFGDNLANTTFVFDNAVSSCGMYVGVASSTGNLNLVTASTKRMSITSTGIACFTCQVCMQLHAFPSSGGYIRSGGGNLVQWHQMCAASATMNINLQGNGLTVSGNYPLTSFWVQAGLFPGGNNVLLNIQVVANSGGNFTCSIISATCVIGGIGTLTIQPYHNNTAPGTFCVVLTSNCTGSTVYWNAWGFAAST